MPYRYHAFGLQIESEIELPALLLGEAAPPDLVVRCGAVPSQLTQPQDRRMVYQIDPGRFLLQIEGVARYLICDGSEITLEPYPEAAQVDVRLFLLGSAMGALLHQRGVWPLHGSAVASQRGALIFLGASGSGKSTLAGAFHRRGYRALSDDVCPIQAASDGLMHIWPAYPRLNLWPDSVKMLGEQPAHLQHAHTMQDKYVLSLPRFSREPAPVYAVYVLSAAEQSDLRLTLLKGFDKVRELTENTYRLHFLTGMQLAEQHFQQAQALARQVRLARITRPVQPFLLDELADLIEEDAFQ